MTKTQTKSMLALAVTLASRTVFAQMPIESSPGVAPMSMPAPAAPVAPVAQVVTVPTEVTVQLHPITRFGTHDQMFIGGATSGTFYGRHTQLHNNKGDAFLLNASLSLGWFPVDNFAYGLKGGAQYSNSSSNQTLALDVGPFLGFNVPLHHHLSFFPNLAGLYVYNNAMPQDGQSSYGHEIDVQLELSFVIHAAEHLSFTVSPYARQSVYTHVGQQDGTLIVAGQGYWVTTYGINLGVLGWY